MVNKSITGSHSGTLSWLAQRVSALVILFAVLLLALAFWYRAPDSYTDWQVTFHLMSIKMDVWLLTSSLCLHAWIGLRDVLMDYVKPFWLRLGLSVLILLVLVLCVVWVSVILWGGNG